MQKVGEDWRGTTVTHTFKVLLNDIRRVMADDQPYTSELCGLGWQFTLERWNESSVRLSFEPNLIRRANIGQVDLSALLFLQKELASSTSIQLSESGSEARSSLTTISTAV